MVNKIIFSIIFSLLLSANVPDQSTGQIEIYDISKSKVIKEVPVGQALQEEVEKFLHEISDVYRNIKPIPNKGFMVKVPLEPAIMIQNQWLNDLVDEVIIIFPNQEEPYLMVFDIENRPYFFTFTSDTGAFLKKLEFNPKTILNEE